MIRNAEVACEGGIPVPNIREFDHLYPDPEPVEPSFLAGRFVLAECVKRKKGEEDNWKRSLPGNLGASQEIFYAR